MEQRDSDKRREGEKGGGDGLTVDTKGNLYITSGLGLQVFAPDGKQLGIIALPEQPANCDFGGPDMKTLYLADSNTGKRAHLLAFPLKEDGTVGARWCSKCQFT